MPLVSPVAFPLFPILEDGTCGCGTVSCSRIGKHPAVLWKDLQSGSKVPTPEPGAGVGIKTGARPKGSGVIVVDLDGPEASLAFEDLGGCDDTYTVETGRMAADGTPTGWQLYFQHPGFPVRNSAGDLAKGIDIRGDGGFVVAAGSPHKSGKKYECIEDFIPAPCPAWLVAWLKKRPAAQEAQQYDGDVSGAERLRRKEMYAKYLANEAPARGPALRGQGDSTLFTVVQHGAYDLALSVEDVLELVREHYDPRCDPMWGDELDERVHHKANQAKTESKRPRLVPLSEEEEFLLEPTRLSTAPSEDTDAEDDNCGFDIRWDRWDEEPVPTRYLVEDFLAQNKLSMIFADAGSIKSWTAIDLAMSVASGSPWLNEHQVVQGPVVYVDFEDGEHEFHRRVSLLRRCGKPTSNQFGYMYSPANLDQKDLWLRLDKLQNKRGISLFVLDTLAGGTPGTDENDRNAAVALQYAGQFISMVEKRGGSVAVLVLHHANKSGEIRGTSAFKASVDTLFKLETLKDDSVTGIHQSRLSCVKSGQRKVPTLCLEFSDDGLRTFEATSDDKETAVVDKRSVDQLQAEVLLHITNHGPVGSIPKLREIVKAKTSTVSAVVNELEARGDIFRSELGYLPDTDTLRLSRLAHCVRAHEGWGKAKLTADAAVSNSFFDKCLREGRLVPRSSGREVEGFLWI